jgi:drug/metabolite transporter (DMT)-like permease
VANSDEFTVQYISVNAHQFMAESFSSVGLLMAAATSVSNVIKDVGAKKVVESHEVVAATFWIRLFAAFVFVAALLVRAQMGYPPAIRNNELLFGTFNVTPFVGWVVWLSIEVVLVACNTLIYFRALQVTPISLCMPYISFTPVFLLYTNRVMNNETITNAATVGVLLIVVGSFVMHRQLFSKGWLEPIKAIWRERGCFLMLVAGFVNAITNPIDKKLVTMTDPFTQACAFGIGMVLFFSILALARRTDLKTVVRAVPQWLVLAGVLEAVALIFQLASHNYIQVVITISVKRAGIILTVLLGWLVFREKDIGDKLIAASVMLVGVLIIYLKLTFAQSCTMALAGLVAMAIALMLTGKRTESKV